MPRTKRALSQSGVYHVMLRGINRQRIFAILGTVLTIDKRQASPAS